MTENQGLEARVRALEWQLDDYHERLEHALDHDRQFQLKATWGIVTSICGAFAMIGTIWLANKLGIEGWVFGIVVGVAGIFAYGAGAAWADRGREDDLKKLSRLPKWRRE